MRGYGARRRQGEGDAEGAMLLSESKDGFFAQGGLFRGKVQAIRSAVRVRGDDLGVLMENYKHILLGVDFSGQAEFIAGRAKDLSEKYQAKLSLVHVLDNLPITDAAYGPVIPFDVDLTEELMEAAKTRLASIADKLGVAEENRWLELGSPKLEIIRVANENAVDLIVIGSHGRHGLALLLGSTANGVLHHAKCDVLAVRIKDD